MVFTTHNQLSIPDQDLWLITYILWGLPPKKCNGLLRTVNGPFFSRPRGVSPGLALIGNSSTRLGIEWRTMKYQSGHWQSPKTCRGPEFVRLAALPHTPVFYAHPFETPSGRQGTIVELLVRCIWERHIARLSWLYQDRIEHEILITINLVQNRFQGFGTQLFWAAIYYLWWASPKLNGQLTKRVGFRFTQSQVCFHKYHV